MSKNNRDLTKEKKGIFTRALDSIEKVGNALPHPVTLFFIFCVAIAIISHIAYKMGMSIEFTQIQGGEVITTNVAAISLLTAEGIRYMFTSAVGNFTSFAPLGTVLVAMLGVGVAEGTGFISALLKKIVLKTPKGLITAMVVFLGIMSNVASDAGYVVLVPLGAIIFMSFGRHPIAGIAAAFAGVSGGFSANLMIGTLDPLLAGISTEAAQMIDPNYIVTATANLYFMIVSTFLITILGTIVTERLVEPRLGEYKGSHEHEDSHITTVSDDEHRGLKFAGVSMFVFALVMGALVLPQNAILRDVVTGEILGNSPFITSIVTTIMLFFLIPGVAYGIGSGTIKSDKDVVHAMSNAMSSMGGYLVLSFFAAQFIAYFSYTNLGIILAANGAEFLESIGFVGFPLVIGFILVAAFINLFIGSASAKWAIMAPVFVPMFMQLGFTPEFTQVAYRIGDSVSNIITPLMAYFAVIIAFAQKYDEEAGIGTLISTMLPYSIVFLLGWTVLLAIWYGLALPLGPGVNMFL